MIPFIYNDGGRAAAGFKGTAGDCVTRAIAIATRTPYREVYDALWELDRELAARKGTRATGPRNGMRREAYDAYLRSFSWTWTPTMFIGTGCLMHLDADELPEGRLVVRLSKHMTAVCDGYLLDTYDCSRDGTRCVYGYWSG